MTGDLRGFPADLPRYYHRCPQMPLAGVPPAPFRRYRRGTGRSRCGCPAGRGSCAAAVRALDGQLSRLGTAQPRRARADQEVP